MEVNVDFDLPTKQRKYCPSPYHFGLAPRRRGRAIRAEKIPQDDDPPHSHLQCDSTMVGEIKTSTMLLLSLFLSSSCNLLAQAIP